MTLLFSLLLIRLDVVDVQDRHGQINIRSAPEGIILTLRWSKTDQAADGVEIGISKGRRPATCPVRILRALRRRIRFVLKRRLHQDSIDSAFGRTEYLTKKWCCLLRTKLGKPR